MNNTLNDQILDKIANYDNVIWDWNGTIIDDVETAVICINKLLVKYALEEITVSHYRSIFDFPVKKYYEKLGFNLEKIPFEVVRDQYINDYNASVAQRASLFPNIEDLLIKVSKIKKQYILSAVSQWHLDEITNHFNLHSLFLERFGVNDHYASSKLSRGEELISSAQLNPHKTILIGDTLHDFEVAKSLQFDCLLLADGHQAIDRLKKVTSNVLDGRKAY